MAADKPKMPKTKMTEPRPHGNKIPMEERLSTYHEVDRGLTLDEAMKEAGKCLTCRHHPCSVQGCPLHNPIKEWLTLTAEGKIMEAAALSRTTSNLPDVCGRLCPYEKLCEGHCVVGIKNEPIAIGAIERFVNDYAEAHGGLPLPAKKPATGRRVAVVGAGPAGIAVAEECLKEGHAVVMYDAWPKPGGLLVYGIPGFKMDKDVNDRKFRHLFELGLEFVGDTTVGRDKTLDGLLAEGFDSVFLGFGATAGKKLRVEGEDLPGVHQATPFLVRNNLPAEDLPEGLRVPDDLTGQRVVVLGGGDTAMDCVRTAIRKQPAAVTCVYRRDEANMPGLKKEVRNAHEEGVQFFWYAQPVKIHGDANGISEVECIKMELGEPDEKGRRRPIEMPGTNFRIGCDVAVLALGYDVEQTIPKSDPQLQLTRWGTVIIDEDTGETAHKGVYAAGDCVIGADLIVTAVAQGRRAARGINAYLEALGPKTAAAAV